MQPRGVARFYVSYWRAMLNIKTILLTVDFPNTSLPVIHQAAILARHFNSEIVALHVVTAESRNAGVPADGPGPASWDMLAEIIRVADEHMDRSLGPELDGLTVRPVLARSGTAEAIVRTVQDSKADLIMMPSHGHTFDHFLLASGTTDVLRGSGPPVWTSSHVEESPVRELTIRNVLCAVDFTSRDRKAVSWAAQIAADFGARLTLAHVTAGVELWGPGGNYVVPRLKETLVSDASRLIAELQQDMGTKAEVFIGSGNAATVLSQATEQTQADLLVTGCYPYGGHLTHAYPIICAVPIPVLSV
jgi:nucleotide-binding universal stress UspA family protein